LASIKWCDKWFTAIVDSGVIKNHIVPKVVKRLGLLYKQKLEPYTLVMILGDLVLYKDKMINLKTGLVQVSIKGRDVMVNFNVLLLGQDEVVLGMI
jgi:hypothetical protein